MKRSNPFVRSVEVARKTVPLTEGLAGAAVVAIGSTFDPDRIAVAGHKADPNPAPPPDPRLAVRPEDQARRDKRAARRLRSELRRRAAQLTKGT